MDEYQNYDYDDLTNEDHSYQVKDSPQKKRQVPRFVFLLSGGLFLIILLFMLLSGEPPDSIDSTDGLATKIVHDEANKFITKTAPNGNKTILKYNQQNLPTEINYTSGSVRYGYDENGNRIWMQDKTGTTEYYYDAFDRLTGVIWKHSPWRLIHYQYDPWNNIKSIRLYNLDLLQKQDHYKDHLRELSRDIQQRDARWIYFESKFQALQRQLHQENLTAKPEWLDYEVNYQYDLLGRLRNIEFDVFSVGYFYYPEKWQIERRLIKNNKTEVKTWFTYSPDDLLKSIRHENSAGHRIVEYRYDYDAAGRVIKVNELINSIESIQTYVWDARGYLNELHLRDGMTLKYHYDAMGNRIRTESANGVTQYRYDTFGRLLAADDMKFDWDLNGNLVNQKNNQFDIDIRYNGRNLPVLLKAPDTNMRLRWDGDGHLISRNINSEVTHFLPNPISPTGFTLAEFDKTNDLSAAYLYGDVLLGQQSKNGDIQFFLEDGFNSIRHIIDGNGNLIDRVDYTPFAYPAISQNNFNLNFRIAGERYISEINSYIIGGRIYDPQIARYHTPDPFPGFVDRFDSFNQYAHGCSAPGTFMRPRCNQFGSLRKYRRGDPIQSMLGQTTQDWTSPAIPLWDMKARFEIIKQFGESLVEDPPGGNWLLGGLTKTALDVLRIFGSGPWVASQEFGEVWGTPTSSAWQRTLSTGGLGLETMGLMSGAAKLLRLKGPLQALGLKALTKQGGYNLLISPQLDRLITSGGLNSWNRGLLGMAKTADIFEKGLDIYDKSSNVGQALTEAYGDLFTSIQTQLGGIDLSATGHFVGDIGSIRGAVYDPVNQYLILVGDREIAAPAIRAGDLAIALKLVFDSSLQDPQFTLNPANPAQPRGKFLKKIFLPEKNRQILEGTPFGDTLFEADWLLKEYAFGVMLDDYASDQGRNYASAGYNDAYISWSNYNADERIYSVSGFMSTAQLSLKSKSRASENESWARFWIVVDDRDDDPAHNMTLRQSPDGKSIYFEIAKMGARARKIVPDPNSFSGFRDVDSQDDPIATRFAQSFTTHYDALARESSEFERLKQLAKAIAFAKWLKKEGIPIDMSWVSENLKTKTTLNRDDRVVPSLSVHWEKKYKTSTHIMTQQLYLFGGVDLTVNPKFIKDNGKSQSLSSAVLAQLRQGKTGPVFEFEHQGKRLRAAILPVTMSARDLWKKSPTILKDGITYYINEDGEIYKSVDRGGNITEYTYDSNRQLKSARRSHPDRWTLEGEKRPGGSFWKITNPRDNVFSLKYDKTGDLKELALDGRKWASYERDLKNGTMTAHYDNFTEEFSYDSKGRLEKYQKKSYSEGQSDFETEELKFQYDNFGNLTQVSGEGIPTIRTSYSKDGKKVTGIHQGNHQQKYTYDRRGRLKKITDPESNSVEFSYGEEELNQIKISNRGKQAEYLFGDEGLIRSRDLSGHETVFTYIDGKLSSVANGEYGHITYVYDELNRISEMHFPDGKWIEFQYRSVKEANGRQTQQMVQVMHPPSGEPALLERDIVTVADAVEKEAGNTTIWGSLPGNTSIQAFQKTGDGQAAILSKAGEQDLLTYYENGKRVKTIKGPKAAEEFGDIEREIVKTASGEGGQFIYAQPLQGKIDLQIGIEHIQLSDAAFRQALTEPESPGGKRIKRAIEKMGAKGEFIVYRGAQDRRPPSHGGSTLTGTDADPIHLAARLKENYNLNVFIDDETDIAKRNLKKIKPIRGVSEVGALVPQPDAEIKDYHLLKDIRRQLENFGIKLIEFANEAIQEPNIIIISVHNDENLSTYLRDLGEKGFLRDKVVLLNTCNTKSADILLPNLNHELITKYGANAIFLHPKKISVGAVKRVMLEVGLLLRQMEANGESIHPNHLFQQAAERILKSDASDELKLEVQKYIDGTLQISVLYPGKAILTIQSHVGVA